MGFRDPPPPPPPPPPSPIARIAALIGVALIVFTIVAVKLWRYFRPLKKAAPGASPSTPGLQRGSSVSDMSGAAKKPPQNWLTRRKFFKKMLHDAFKEADMDNEGTVDAKEVYSMILSIYVKINRIARADPPEKKQVWAASILPRLSIAHRVTLQCTVVT